MRRLLLTTQDKPSLAAVRSIRHQLDTALQCAVHSEAHRQRMQLVLDEALTNLVAHADPQPSYMQVNFGLEKTRWWLEIIDDGGAWNPLIQDTHTGFDTFELKEQGLGLGLIQTLSDQQVYHHDESCNRLQLAWDMPETRSRPCVLIVDDDAAQCRLLAAYLDPQFHTLIATNGQQALELLKNEAISLVLSDIQMPDMDGLALRQRLSEYPDKQLTPFIFLSGHSDQHLLNRAAEMGVDDYLSKPIDKAGLIVKIQRVLGRSEQIRNAMTDRLDSAITQALACSVPDSNPHWEIAAFSRNTGQGGGDFVLHREHAGQLQLVLADTMGHDDCAKFFSYAYAGYLRGFFNAHPENIAPEKLLEQLSEAALQDQLFSRVTLTCCALLMKPEGEISLACAAHPPALLITESGVEAIDAAGLLLGLIPDTRYQPVSLKLKQGERIAIYTDGLFDAASSQEGRQQLEKEILAELIATRSRPLKDALSRIESRFDQLVGTHPKDDATLILIEPLL